MSTATGRLRFFRQPDGGWRRYEPWMTTLVDADTGRLLGVVDGRDSAGVGAWLAARAPAWRAAVEVVAIDRRRRSAARCANTCRRPPSASTRSTWSSWPTTWSPRSGSG